MTATRGAVGRLVVIRLLTNAALRIPYPFLPELARGFDTTVAATGAALGAGELAGLAGPAVGARSDRHGHSRAIRLGLLVFGAAALAMALAPSLWWFAAGSVVLGVGKLADDTSVAAWVAERVDFARRGRVMAVIEASWPLALVVGAPIAGLLIPAVGFRSPWLVLAVGGVLAARFLVPDDGPPPAPPRVEASPGAAAADRPARPARRRGALALLGVLGLLAFGVQSVVVVTGAWYEDVGGLSTTAVGVVTVGFAALELVGTGFVLVAADRIGKTRAMTVGMAVQIVAVGALALGAGTPAVGYGALAAAVIGFETAYVACFPLVTELFPGGRAAGVGYAFALLTLGRSAGNVVGSGVYAGGGMQAAAKCALPALVLGTAVLVALVRDPTPDFPVAR